MNIQNINLNISKWCRSIVLFLAVICMGCEKSAVNKAPLTDERIIAGRGVDYIVPWETSDVEETDTRFKYKGESITVVESGGRLTIDGKEYGAVNKGDKVNLLTKGTVIVNGTERIAK